MKPVQNTANAIRLIGVNFLIFRINASIINTGVVAKAQTIFFSSSVHPYGQPVSMARFDTTKIITEVAYET